MKDIHLIIYIVVAVLLSACSLIDDAPSDQAVADGDGVYIRFNLFTNQTGASLTRGMTVGDIDARNRMEGAIYDVQVWAFTHLEDGADAATVAAAYNEYAVAYCDAVDLTTSDDLVEMKMFIATEYLRTHDLIDLYVLVNPKSIGHPLQGVTHPRRSTLRSATFGGNYFGVQTPTEAVQAGRGLPFSLVYKGSDGHGVSIRKASDFGLNDREDITLKRAVARYRFVFSRLTDVEDVEISRIEFDNNLIVQDEYIFEGENTPSFTGSYVEAKITHATPLTDIGRSADPTEYRSDRYNLTAQEYENRINAAIDGLHATEYGLTYMRETDKPLSGTIYYKLGGASRTARFSMEGLADTYFYRNYSWLVYGYFDKRQLTLTATTLPWEVSEETLDYTNVVTLKETLQWTDGTYDDIEESQGGGYSLVLKRSGRVAAEGRFQFDSPRGGTWYASFDRIDGSDNAFEFVDADGQSLGASANGTIDGGWSVIRIRPVSATTAHTNTARLNLAVRSGGETMEVPSAQLSRWTIIQNEYQ